MKIVTLIENLVNKAELVAEHGLSLYLDSGSKKLLFDTGQGPAFISNARRLGIDLQDIDYVILSHGHYDHAGGLYPFLEINHKAKILAKKEIFDPKYNSQKKFIGTLPDPEKLQNRMTYVEEIMEVIPEVFIIPHIPLHFSQDTSFDKLYCKRGDSFFPDQFEDELFVCIRGNHHIHIVTACSHRGITNICETARQTFQMPLGMVLGGFHIRDCGIEQYVHVTNYLREHEPKHIGASHCTGVDRFATMSQELNSKVFYNHTGNEISLK